MLFTGFKVGKYEFVNIIVPATAPQNEFYFPDLPNLRNAQVQAISLYTDAIIAANPDGIALLSTTDATRGFLILNINDKEEIKIPLVSTVSLFTTVLPTLNLGNQNGYLPFNNQVITWSKSYVKFPQGHAATQFAIGLGVFYK